MKKLFLIVSMVCFTICLGTSCCNNEKVYICTGTHSTVYHKTNNCRGLNRCKGDIKKITKKSAENNYRRPCKICY